MKESKVMQVMIEAVLSNADHPEYGVVTIPLPIPREQYDHLYTTRLLTVSNSMRLGVRPA